MESEGERGSLDRIEALRARVARMPRQHSVLQLAHAVLLAAYVGVLVFTGSAEGGANLLAGTTAPLVIVPVIVSSALVGGANERFGERLRSTRADAIATAGLFVLLIAVYCWAVVGDGYPWWVAVAVAAITAVLFGARPLRVLLRAPIDRESSVDEGFPLSTPVRAATAFLGFFFGVTCACVLVPGVIWFVMMLGMIVVVIGLLARATPWGFQRVGYEWRLPQWTAFGIATLVMFLLAVLLLATDAVTPPIAVGAGVIVAASLIASAFVPSRRHASSPA